MIPVEIKVGTSIYTRMFEGIDFWHKFTGNPYENSFLIYGGNDSLQQQNKTQLIGWQDTATVLAKIETNLKTMIATRKSEVD